MKKDIRSQLSFLLCCLGLFLSIPTISTHIVLSKNLNGENLIQNQPGNQSFTIREESLEVNKRRLLDTDEVEDEGAINVTSNEESQDKVVIGTENEEESDSSDYDLEDTTDKSPLPEESNIILIGARIDEDFHHYEIESCTMIEIPLEGRGIGMIINPLFNAKKFMLTSNQFTDCTQLVEFQCEKSAFCYIQDLYEMSHTELQEEACGFNAAYLYVLPKNLAEPVAFETKIGSTGIQCEAEATGTVNNIDMEFCRNLSVEDCQDTNTDVCSSRCMLVTCSVDSQITGTACMPSNSLDDVLVNMCSGDEEFSNAPLEQRAIQYPVCEQTEAKITHSSFNFSTIDIIALTAIICLIMFLGFTFCYRYQFAKNKRQICNLPSWCPRLLYPRTPSGEEGYVSMNKNKEHEMVKDFQLPVL